MLTNNKYFKCKNKNALPAQDKKKLAVAELSPRFDFF